MKKKEVLEKIEELISKMELNSFLLPDSWSDQIEMVDHAWSYRTYVAAPRRFKENRYINIEIYKEGKKTFDIGFRGNEVEIPHKLSSTQIKPIEVLNYLQAIFDEKHSFANHDEGKRKLRKQITEKRRQVKSLEQDIKGLQDQIKGIDNLKNIES